MEKAEGIRDDLGRGTKLELHKCIEQVNASGKAVLRSLS